MGAMRVRCVRGCRCEPASLVGWHKEETSVWANTPLRVADPSSNCTLALTHERRPSRPSGAPSKVKLLSVIAAPPGHVGLKSNFIWGQTTKFELGRGQVIHTVPGKAVSSKVLQSR